jgi:hypothetical protein
MAKKKSMKVLFGIFVISAWVVGAAIQASAETLKYKFYSWVIKGESVPVADVEGHAVGFQMREGFNVFENGEVGTVNAVITLDLVGSTGPFMWYTTINFQDGSTIIIKGQGTSGETSAASEGEIIKGTGRFEGIKGTQTSKGKFFPLEKGEAGPKNYGEATMTYTLPSK